MTAQNVTAFFHKIGDSLRAPRYGLGMTTLRAFIPFIALCLACSPDGGGGSRIDSGGTDTNGIDGGGRDTNGRDVMFDTNDDCDGIEVEATESVAPVDIVWIIDNSGSMREEATLVQNNLNTFANAVENAGIDDVRVVLITAPGFVDVPAPLGTDPNRFLRVDFDVQSNNGLERLLESYSMYADFLRRNAQLHFAIVTDDESDMNADSFLTQMQGNLGRTFRFHSVASPPGSSHNPFNLPGCSGPNGEAQGNGDVYWDLSSRTGGIRLDICSADWNGLFMDLTRAVAVPQALPCSYDIPPPPAGETFDRNQVNVRYTPGNGGAPETIPNTGGGIESCGPEGWYYSGGTEEMPARVELCPATCSRLEGDASGRVNVAFGCQTVLI